MSSPRSRSLCLFALYLIDLHTEHTHIKVENCHVVHIADRVHSVHVATTHSLAQATGRHVVSSQSHVFPSLSHFQRQTKLRVSVRVVWYC